METSAKTGFNAQNIFIEAAKLLYEQQLKYKDRASRVESMMSSYVRDSNPNAAMNIMNIEEDEIRQKKGCCKWLDINYKNIIFIYNKYFYLKYINI